MITPNSSCPSGDVAGKVLRRAEVAKVARSLQDRLALATFKAQNGWQNRTLSTIEPEVTEHLRRKRPYSSGDVFSDSSSNTSVEYSHCNSSPLTAPAFSDELSASKHSRRSRLREPPSQYLPDFASRKRLRSSSNAASANSAARNKSWKQSHRLAHSSPVFQRPHLPVKHMHQFFVSDAATIPEPRYHARHLKFPGETTPTSPSHEQHLDLPVHSFNSPTMIASSPPRTPSPFHDRIPKSNSKDAGADLLLYLANSPSRSPAINQPSLSSHRREFESTTSGEPPSTPPSQKTTTTTAASNNLPSSFLSTPTTTSNSLNLPLFSTPGQHFNFADFVNVTPSPAQAPWGVRTPGTVNKTPAAAARRGLNFDTLVPPTTGEGDRGSALKCGEVQKGRGLALELGDKLMPRS